MSFNIAAFTDGTARVVFEDIDYDAFKERPLSDGALRTLRSMSDIESYTICYLRDVLVTPSHAEPDVTAFLTMWAFEEFWHGEALDKVLLAHGIETGAAHLRAVRERLGLRGRMDPIVQSIFGNLVGEAYVAVHMTWGAINEWTAHSGYARLAEREDHPELTKLLNRIMKQESRHIAFYTTQARERLAESRWAQRLTRYALRKFWAPVGSTILKKDDLRHMLEYLLGGGLGRKYAKLIDDRVDKLPGLAGLNLMDRAITGHGIA